MLADGEQGHAVDNDLPRRALHYFTFSGQFIQTPALMMKCGIHGRHLVYGAAKPRQDFLQGLEVKITVPGEGYLPPGILGIRGSTQTHSGLISFAAFFD